MARQMDIDGEIFRAVVTKPKMVRNPKYDWTRHGDEPAYIPHESETVTKAYGPYKRKGDARVYMNRNMHTGYGGPIEGVHGHVEKAHVVWEVVE